MFFGISHTVIRAHIVEDSESSAGSGSGQNRCELKESCDSSSRSLPSWDVRVSVSPRATPPGRPKPIQPAACQRSGEGSQKDPRQESPRCSAFYQPQSSAKACKGSQVRAIKRQGGLWGQWEGGLFREL